MTREEYLDTYPKIIALASGFSTGGYAPSFVTDWLEQRIKTGDILEQSGSLAMSETAKAALLHQLNR